MCCTQSVHLRQGRIIKLRTIQRPALQVLALSFEPQPVHLAEALLQRHFLALEVRRRDRLASLHRRWLRGRTLAVAGSDCRLCCQRRPKLHSRGASIFPYRGALRVWYALHTLLAGAAEAVMAWQPNASCRQPVNSSERQALLAPIRPLQHLCGSFGLDADKASTDLRQSVRTGCGSGSLGNWKPSVASSEAMLRV